jgi:hypothetical protein
VCARDMVCFSSPAHAIVMWNIASPIGEAM